MMKISFAACILAAVVSTLVLGQSAEKRASSMERAWGGLLIVVSQGNNTASIIEPESGRSLAVIRTGGGSGA
jgi:hypothetical protein